MQHTRKHARAGMHAQVLGRFRYHADIYDSIMVTKFYYDVFQV